MGIYVLGMIITTYVVYILREQIAGFVRGSYHAALIQVGAVFLWPLLASAAVVVIGVGLLLWVGNFVFQLVTNKG
jgi:hypothetical protein